MKLIAFEMAGRAKSTWHHFYDTANLVLFIVDAIEMREPSKIEKTLKKMDRKLPADAKIIVVYNKIDLILSQEGEDIDQ